MAVAAAEQTHGLNHLSNVYDLAPQLVLVEDIPRPEIILASQLPHEAYTQARFDSWIGSLSLSETVTTNPPETEKMSADTDLLENIKAAKAGSVEHRARLLTNIKATTSEVVFKKRHIRKVKARRDEAGAIVQHGQSMRSIHRNAILMRPNRKPILKEITAVEALHGHRIEDAHTAGVLEDNIYVAVSIVPPKGVQEKDLDDRGDGYFLDDLTLCVQGTTAEGDDISIESAFMAGIENGEKLTFEERMNQRFDIKAIALLYEWFGRPLNLEVENIAADILDNALIIPKELMPNGMADFMRWYDLAVDVVLGRILDRNPQEYIEIVELSKRREASLEEVNRNVYEGMLAVADQLETAMHAVRMKWKLAKKYTVDEAFVNNHIDPGVFGSAASQSIIMGRIDLAQGNHQEFLQHRLAAHKQAKATGCGGGYQGNDYEIISDFDSESEHSSDPKGDEDEYGSLSFTCTEGHTNTRPRGKLISSCRVKSCTGSVAC